MLQMLLLTCQILWRTAKGGTGKPHALKKVRCGQKTMSTLQVKLKVNQAHTLPQNRERARCFGSPHTCATPLFPSLGKPISSYPSGELFQVVISFVKQSCSRSFVPTLCPEQSSEHFTLYAAMVCFHICFLS